jgi:hypothetical protein
MNSPEHASLPPSSDSSVTLPLPDQKSLFARVLQALREFKELIGILVFFGVGVAWVIGYVATKSQLGELRCLMQSQIDLIKYQNDFNAARAEMIDVNTVLETLTKRQAANGNLDSLERQQFFDFSTRLEDLKKKRATAQEKSDHVRADLDHNACAAK